MLETILIAVVGTTIGIVVRSLNANVAHRQPFLTDKADFYFDEMYSRYAAQKNPKDFTAEDESIIWEYASNHIAMFLTWVIDNGFYGNIHYEASDDIQLVKARKMTGTEFHAKHCDYRLSDEDFSPEILPFVECYYFQKYIQQYDKLFSKKAMALLHPSPFSWEDYDLIAKRITRAYKLWKFCGSGKLTNRGNPKSLNFSQLQYPASQIQRAAFTNIFNIK